MRCYSLAYLTASNSTIPEFIQIASQVGYAFVGLRLRPNSPGAPFQNYVDDVAIQNETKKRLDDTGVKVFDIEIIRIGEQFNLSDYVKLLEAGAKLKAKALSRKGSLSLGQVPLIGLVSTIPFPNRKKRSGDAEIIAFLLNWK